MPLNLTLEVASLNGNWSWGFGTLGTLNITVEVPALGNATVSFLVNVLPGNPASTSETFVLRASDPSWAGVEASTTLEVRSTG